jgi:nucleoside-diphosphate-sugar epimerase
VNFKKIFITGGAGYCGSRLVPFLLEKKYEVTVFDTFYFGNFLPKYNKKLKIVKGDIRDVNLLKKSCKNHDVFINLACISNDTSFILNEKLSTSINLDAFEPMVIASKESGIKRFIYASSSSVYGVSEKKNVREDHPLVPLTLYNKYKGMCEPLLLKHTNDNFEGVIFRPATVCGYSPRMRLDLSVNILTNFAITNKEILVFGGKQLRPNLHIQDYCDVLLKFIKADSRIICNQIYNVGYENLSIINIAKQVKEIIGKKIKENINIRIEKSSDNRSYHINSEKIYNDLCFKPKRNIESAIIEIYKSFKKGLIKNSFSDPKYYNVRTLKKINAK